MTRPAAAAILALTLVVAGCDRRSAALLAETDVAPLELPVRAVPPPAPGWWNDAVFYEIFVRSFRDADGDGKGDLRGLIERLDYLNDGDSTTTGDLGVTGLWLMPVAESPSYHGYDVADYVTVDREYGTNGDFRLLMAEAHRRGIRVVVDFVLNHTSDRHPWFVASAASRRGPMRDFYVWSDHDPGFMKPWGGSPWNRHETGWYYGIFWSGMPDLNYRNPRVTLVVEDAARVWLADLDADGFRLDAVKHLIEVGDRQEHTPETRRWLGQFRAFTKTVRPDALTVGEVWSGVDEVAPYIRGGSLDLAFEFSVAGAILQSASFETRHAVAAAHRAVVAGYPDGQYAPFLSNHDQRRVMSVLAGSVARARSAASLLLTGPGVPFLYYGEEIGQSGEKPDENLRSPMQWSGAPGAGFTDGPAPWRAPQPDFTRVNVATQDGDPRSLLSHYRRLIHLRNAHPALRRGSWREVPAGDDRVYAILREGGGETLLVLVNLSASPVEHYALALDTGPLRRGTARELLEGAHAAPPWLNGKGGFEEYRPFPVLEPYTTRVLALD